MIDFNIGYEEMAAMPPGREKALQYCASALLWQESPHHMTWCIEEAVKALGVSLEYVRKNLHCEEGYDWEPGIPP